MLLDEPGRLAAPTTSSNNGFFAIIFVVALLAGVVGGAATILWGQPLLQQLGLVSSVNNPAAGNTVNAPASQTLSVQEESATTEVVKKMAPSVVSIIISKDLSKIYNLTGPNPFPFDNFFGPNSPFNFFFGGQQRPSQQQPPGKQEVGGGTGFVIDQAKGLILTNRHVVEDTEADYTVLTNDGKRLDAKVVARDTVNDLALVQVQDKSLPSLELGESDNVAIGQTVIAIGNALGEYRNTVTKGVISGIGRNVVAGDGQGSSESLEGVFQTDAAINPGNSGGPLINLAGQVIGINTAVNKEGQLIGFAIPSNEAKRLVDSFAKYGRIVRPYLGIRYVIVTPELARANKLEVNYGALIIQGKNEGELAVVPGSPADKAGLVENDIILEINGQKIDQEHSLVKQLSRFSPGESVKLKIYHKGKQQDVSIKLEEYKEQK
ncbi:MAG: trypsin-like peptidase domain-containing protein [Candidatus Kerfeldbacteria bacterium]|nr:trypsin-like peptidase domain-containing protein [Candidatus Kerfeldbacteria bacterium]